MSRPVCSFISTKLPQTFRLIPWEHNNKALWHHKIQYVSFLSKSLNSQRVRLVSQENASVKKKFTAWKFWALIGGGYVSYQVIDGKQLGIIANEAIAAFAWIRGESLSIAELKIIGKTLELPEEQINDATERNNYQKKCFAAALQACEKGEWEKIKRIKPYMPKLKNAEGYTLFLALTKIGNVRCVIEFTDHFKDTILIHEIDSHGNNALHIASIQGNHLLIDHLSNFLSINSINYANKTAVELAIENGRSLVLNILGKNIDLDRHIFSYLTLCVKKGELGCFEVLLSCLEARFLDPSSRTEKLNAKILDKDDQKNSLLHLTVLSGQTEMLEHLVKYRNLLIKTHINNANSNGDTPLHLACFRGDEKIIRVLVAQGANLNAQNKEGLTCVHIAAERHLPETIQVLSFLGADLTTIDNKNRTPLSILKDATGPQALNCKALLEKLSVARMIQIKSAPNYLDNPPENIVLQGGGARGSAYPYALKKMQEMHLLEHVKRYLGTSAGAITAGLAATGHTPEELEKLLEKDLTSFLDYKNPNDAALGESITSNSNAQKVIGVFKSFWNGGAALIHPVAQSQELYRKLTECPGICKGDALRDFVEKQIQAKTGIVNCTFKELQELCKKEPNKFAELHIYTTKLVPNGHAEIVRLSASEEYQNVILSDAVVCSANIPGIFEPRPLYFKDAQGKRYDRRDLGYFVDGGLLKNFGLDGFDERKYQGEDAWGSNTNKRTLGLSLVSNEEPSTPSVNPKIIESPGTVIDILKAYYNFEELLLKEQVYEQDRILPIPVPKEIKIISFDEARKRKLEIKKLSEEAVENFMNKQSKK